MKKLILLLALAAIIVFSGCQKPKLTCEITSPKNGAKHPFFNDLVIVVDAKDTKSSVAAVTVYLDNIPYPCTMTAPYTCTIPSILLTLGKKTIKAVAINLEGDQAEDIITITIVEGSEGSEDESPSFVTFAGGILPPSWKTNTWVIDNAMGFTDNYSLRSTNYLDAVLTHKTMNSTGVVEFYTRGDNFDLFIGGEKALPYLTESVAGQWKRWVYAFNEGRHSFRWENTNVYAVYLDDIKFLATTLADVNTTLVSEIGFNSATCGGTINDDGNSPIIQRGVCWSTSPNPTIENSKTVDGSGTGSFVSKITGLQSATTYYVRAYAVNSVGVGYGAERSFKTVTSNLTPGVYSISLYDSYGDGWHGNNFVSVKIGNTYVLNNITLANGYGPYTRSFSVGADQTVTIYFTSGSYADECYYKIFSGGTGTGTPIYESSRPPQAQVNL